MATKNKDGVVLDEELNRAAQFLPFDALKGLSEELRKREERHTRVEKVELSEEETADLNDKLCLLTGGDRVEITFYYKGHYLTIEGDVVKMVPQMHYLTIGQTNIPFDDIRSIKIL